MIYRTSEATDLETIVSIQRAALRQFMSKYRMSMITYLEERERIQWSWQERP